MTLDLLFTKDEYSSGPAILDSYSQQANNAGTGRCLTYGGVSSLCLPAYF